VSSITIVSNTPNWGVTYDRYYDDRNVFIIQAQGDQIGRNFAIWAFFYGVGQIFFVEKVAQSFGRNFSHEKIAQN
jgi:hypothetical protein